MSAYRSLEALFARVSLVESAAGILGWDAQTLMPIGAAEGRSEQLALLRGLSHDLVASPATGNLLQEAEADAGDLDPWQSANLREMGRTYVHASAVPQDLVIASLKATSAGEIAWREARRTSDFKLLLPYLKEVLNIQRQIGEAQGAVLGLSTYDALLETFDPGLRQASVASQ